MAWSQPLRYPEATGRIAEVDAHCQPQSAAGLELDESSWRPAFFVAPDEDPVFGDELFGFWLAATLIAIRKISAGKRDRRGETPQFFFCFLTLLMLVFGCDLSSRAERRTPRKRVDQALYAV